MSPPLAISICAVTAPQREEKSKTNACKQRNKIILGTYHSSPHLVLHSPRLVMHSHLQDGKPGLCAAAVLVGIDVSPQPGLRGPTNFAGLCGPALLDELESVLSAAGDRFRCILQFCTLYLPSCFMRSVWGTDVPEM